MAIGSSPSSSWHVAVIGAGVAGMAAARRLREAGVAVSLFDKGRRPGGRVATRRAPDGSRYDHGAAFFTARDAGFRGLVDRLAAERHVAAFSKPGRWVGVPTMSALPQAMAEGLDVACAVRITLIAREGEGFRLHDEAGGSRGPFTHVIVAVPAPQAADLLEPISPAMAVRARQAVFAPCWAVMAEWDEPLPLPDVLERPTPDLGWAARESAKPGRAPGERWVLHGSAEWSSAHLEDDPAEAIEGLLGALSQCAGQLLPSPAWSQAHRWRYARVVEPLGESCLIDGDRRIAACGDWCLGARVEEAYTSGVAAVRALSGEAQ